MPEDIVFPSEQVSTVPNFSLLGIGYDGSDIFEGYVVQIDLKDMHSLTVVVALDKNTIGRCWTIEI